MVLLMLRVLMVSAEAGLNKPAVCMSMF
jgi:hypothetical protein